MMRRLAAVKFNPTPSQLMLIRITPGSPVLRNTTSAASRVSLRPFPSYRKFRIPYRANSVSNKSSIEDFEEIRRMQSRVYNRLVAGVLNDLELLDQSEHLRARLQVVVASTACCHRLLAEFLDFSRSDGLLALLK
jgi:hypothetical protein